MRLPTACLVLLLSTGLQAAAGLSLEGGPFLPYRINHGAAVQAEGVLGRVELLGRRWDGTLIPLFRTRVTARSQAVELFFYLDEDIRGLELKVDEQGERSSAVLDLAAGAALTPASETALRNRMRGLDPPVHLARNAEAPERFSLGGSDLVMAGFQTSYALFAIPVTKAPLALLGGFVLTALIAMAVVPSTPRRRALSRLLTLGAALGATVAIVPLAVPRSTLYIVAFSAEGSDARVSGVVERWAEERPGYTRITYAAGQGEGVQALRTGTVELIGFWAPAGRGIPALDLAPSGSLVRFSTPPLATMDAGEPRFGSKEFITGWVVHAPR